MREVLQRLRRRFARLLRPRRVERQLEDDLRFHVESETAAKVAAGMSDAEARRLTLAELGGVERWRDEVRDQRPARSLELVWHDARLALRALLRTPSYALPAVATLALGLGTLATIAALTSAILLRPLPYRAPERLVAVWEQNTLRNRTHNVVGATAFEAWRTRSRTLEGVTAFMPASLVWVNPARNAERVFGAEVSPNMFALLGRRPLLGAGFSPGLPVDEIVISHALWTQRLGSDSAIIGRQVRFGARSLTVVGVMPNDFAPVRFGWMAQQEFWLPLVVTAAHQPWGRFLTVAGRLAPGATLDALGRELNALSAQLVNEKALAEGWDAHAVPLVDEMTGSVKPAIVTLAIASLLLLAMVVTNTALLTLAFLRQREPDRALRIALGATGSRLRGERLITSAMLALIGAGFGVLLASVAIPILVQLLPTDVPRLDTVHFDAVASLSLGGAALLVMLVLVLLPARRVFGSHGLAVQSARTTRRSRATWLIVAEAAFALVLMVLASLTVRSFDRLRSVDVGFDPNSLVAFRLGLVDFGATDSSALVVFDGLLEQLRAIPGVTAAGIVTARPLRAGPATTIAPLGTPEAKWSSMPVADVRVVSPGYFEALGMNAIAGRLLSGREVRGAATQAVVTETLVRTLWPDQPNVNAQRFELNMYDKQRPEIIGVVRDIRLSNPRVPPRPTVYLSASQFPNDGVYDVLLRTEPGVAVPLASLRAAIARVAPGAPMFDVASLQTTLADATARERVTAFLLAFFASAALLLVAVGVYGLFGGEVTRRRQEIGVRMALGESAERVVRSIVWRAFLRVLIGIVIGGVGSILATRAVRAMLYGVAPSDILSHTIAIIVVVVTALGATIVPALQAARVDPVRALRAE